MVQNGPYREHPYTEVHVRSICLTWNETCNNFQVKTTTAQTPPHLRLQLQERSRTVTLAENFSPRSGWFRCCREGELSQSRLFP